ncbi:polysaccharide biosynthesis tyrosine autokinase [Nocardioides acrostichi]|uniref:non-specific protein-tyrosine kinase n=1 Tax=Nocardioides acrostichi TaxID=2784339 RepID=A0A930V1W5_9ACTN|nr:polysaccharide biosynthesis tyrosine autokinase [Nocardioides acrostichi]MBF4162524.1 polysaccharide biosynthesis tyrosine autokinase [Nocardioides acrostichi]
MELKDYLRIIRRRWLLIAVTVLVVVGAGAAFTFLSTPQYTSSASLFVTTSTGGDDSTASSAYQGGLFSQQRVQSYADLVTKDQLANTVISDLGLDETSGQIIGEVSATVVPETVVLEITATDPSPAQAQAIAQAYAESLSDLIRQLETPPGKTTAPIKATVVDDAALPTAPSSPQPVRNLGLAVVLGLLLGVGLAVLREVLDTTVKTPEDLEALSSTLLGRVPFDSSAKKSGLVTALPSHAPRVEAFRVLRTNLQFVDVDAQNKVYVVTSALPSEGKTSTSINLALTLASAGARTLLIEGDLRRPKASAQLGIDNAIGVTTALLGRVGWKDAVQRHEESGLDVLPSGAIPPNPAELIQSHAMATLLTEVRATYDVVIFDAPPLLPVVDAALIASQVDGAIVVAKFGGTTRDQLEEAADRLEGVGAHISGAVLNMTPANARRGGYGYGYGYGYAPDAPEPRRKKSKSSDA